MSTDPIAAVVVCPGRIKAHMLENVWNEGNFGNDIDAFMKHLSAAGPRVRELVSSFAVFTAADGPEAIREYLFRLLGFPQSRLQEFDETWAKMIADTCMEASIRAFEEPQVWPFHTVGFSEDYTLDVFTETGEFGKISRADRRHAVLFGQVAAFGRSYSSEEVVEEIEKRRLLFAQLELEFGDDEDLSINPDRPEDPDAE